jgi:NTE family protein
MLLASLALSILPSAGVAQNEHETPSGQKVAAPALDMAEPTSRIGRPVGQRVTTRVGVALGGGGARGAAHVGALKVLVEAGVPIDCIAGTSMGAIVGGMFDAGVPITSLEELFRDRSIMKAFMSEPLSLEIITAPVGLLLHSVGVGKNSYDGLYKGTAFRKFLCKHIGSNKNIQDLDIPFCAVALNLVDGHPYALSKGNLVYAMEASSAVPELRSPVSINDQLFVDGGVMSNVPVNQVRTALNADFVIAVDVDERFHEQPAKTFRKLGSVAARLVSLELAKTDYQDLITADVVIHPDVDGIGLLSSKREDAVRALAAGEAATRMALPAIEKALKARGISFRFSKID